MNLLFAKKQKAFKSKLYTFEVILIQNYYVVFFKYGKQVNELTFPSSSKKASTII